MIKISAMPVYSGPLDEVYVPIIIPVEVGDEPWANYRMLASDLQGEEGEPGGGTLDFENGLTKTLYDVVKLGGPLTENTVIDATGFTFGIFGLPTGVSNKVLYYDTGTGDFTFDDPTTSRFGVATEDFFAAENRLFTLGDFIFNISTGTGSEEINFQKGDFHVLAADATTPTKRSSIQLQGSAASATTAIRSEFSGGHSVTMSTYTDGSSSDLSFTLGTDPYWEVDNLREATTGNVLYYNDSNGEITWGAAPDGGDGGGTITAENGITKTLYDVVKLGGTGTENTTIAWGAFTFTQTFNSITTDGLTISSSSSAVTGAADLVDVVFSGANVNSNLATHAVSGTNTRTGTTSTNVGVYGTASGGTTNYGVLGDATGSNTGVRGVTTGSGMGVYGQSASGTGVFGQSTSGAGILANSTTAHAIEAVVVGNTTTNAPARVGIFTAQANGTPSTGFGGFLSFQAETDNAGTNRESAQIGWRWTTITDASRTADVFIKTVNNAGAAAEVMKATGAGNVELLQTAKGLGLKSPDGTVHYIVVDNAGALSTTTTPP